MLALAARDKNFCFNYIFFIRINQQLILLQQQTKILKNYLINFV